LYHVWKSRRATPPAANAHSWVIPKT